MGAKKPDKTRAQKELERMQLQARRDEQRTRRLETARLARDQQGFSTGSTGILSLFTRGYLGFPADRTQARPEAQLQGAASVSPFGAGARPGGGSAALLDTAKKLRTGA